MPKIKPRSGSTPSIHVVDTYQGLNDYLAGFKDGKFNLLVLVGSWGIGKSRMVAEALEYKAGWIEGTSTSFGIYKALFEHRNKPLVIDDIDSIYSDKIAVSLLKSVCRTELEKRIAWNARNGFLKREGLPEDFITDSSVLIICNEWKSLNKNVAALEDRGHIVSFEPSPKEVHERAGLWFKDREIYEWYGKRLRRIKVHSFRSYVKAEQLKSVGIEWRREIPSPEGREFREKLARELIEDPSFEGNEDRARAFAKRGGGSRATFFNCRKRLLEDG